MKDIIINCGTDTNDSVDYPDIEKVANEVLAQAALGVIICGTG